MPRYFFNLAHHISGPDLEGSELADIHSARAAALRLCGEMIREIDEKFWEAPSWRLDVADQDNRILFTLTFAAEDPAG